MSKNFELLRQAQRDKGLLDRAYPAVAAPSNGKMHEVLRQAHRAQELMQTPIAAKPFALEAVAPPSRFSREETFKLIQRLFLANRQGAPQMVVFCGVAEESNYGWICGRSAEHLSSQVKGTVCVVDANPRQPSLHSYFKVDGSKGFVNVFTNSRPVKEFIQRIGDGNLSLLPAGSTGAKAHDAPYAGSDRMRQILTELRAEFDYILIDAPTLASEPDLNLLAAQTDGVVLVMEPNGTSSKNAQKAKEDLHGANARVLGVVFNHQPFNLAGTLAELWTKAHKFAAQRTRGRKATSKK